MIRKLRRKFTLVCMLSLLVVLVVILGVVNALNYREIVSDADGVLAMLSRRRISSIGRTRAGATAPPNCPMKSAFSPPCWTGMARSFPPTWSGSSPWTRPP